MTPTMNKLLKERLKELGRYEAMTHAHIDLSEESREAVEHPAHYHADSIEVIDCVEAWGLGFNLGNVLKYIARCQYKNKELEDLKKALFYLKREIATQEKELVDIG